MRFQEMAAHCDAVSAADDNVRMQRRLAIGPKGHITKEGDDLDLLGDRDLLVILHLPIEETEHRIAEGADACKLASRDAVLAGKFLNEANSLVPPAPGRRFFVARR